MIDEQTKEIKEQIRKGIQKVENIREKYDGLRKKYKAKEQECEELKEKLERQKDYTVCYKSDVYEQKKQLKDQLDQLKAENDELKKLLKVRIEDLCDSCGASSMMPMPCKVYEKNLIEIKELLLKTPTDSPMHCVNAKSVILQKISEVIDENRK